MRTGRRRNLQAEESGLRETDPAYTLVGTSGLGTVRKQTSVFNPHLRCFVTNSHSTLIHTATCRIYARCHLCQPQASQVKTLWAALACRYPPLKWGFTGPPAVSSEASLCLSPWHCPVVGGQEAWPLKGIHNVSLAPQSKPS